jgi:hypothetical protein
MALVHKKEAETEPQKQETVKAKELIGGLEEMLRAKEEDINKAVSLASAANTNRAMLEAKEAELQEIDGVKRYVGRMTMTARRLLTWRNSCARKIQMLLQRPNKYSHPRSQRS